jgi:hypothetical protein
VKAIVDSEPRGHAGGWIVVRILLFLLLASLPLLAISAHVFGLMPQRASAIFVVVPLATVLATLTVVAPHRSDRIIGRGLLTGMVACLVYDSFRLFTVYVLGWMGDFIPTMGTWITGDSDIRVAAVVGYVWRYIGDGGGLGISFWIIAFAVGMDRWSGRPAKIVLTAVGFAVFPVWTGLIATAMVARRGETMLFELAPATVGITFIGHVIFGVVLGMGFVRTRRHSREWPWPPITAHIYGPAGVYRVNDSVRIQLERQAVGVGDLGTIGELEMQVWGPVELPELPNCRSLSPSSARHRS